MRLRRICKLHPLGRDSQGRMLHFYRRSCPTCRPGGWVHVPSAEGKMPSRETCAELSAVLRRALGETDR